VSKNRHERYARIYGYAHYSPRKNNGEDGVIDVVQVQAETHEKQEKGEMEERGQGFDYPRKVQLVDSFEKKRTNPRSSLGIV
jgi:hypothetical protein